MELVNGTNDARFDRLREIFTANLETRGGELEELGASIAIDIGGELAVDLWGGYRDKARTLPWEQDTIVNGFSSTKMLTALAMLILVDRGTVDLEAPVATYWPEFAAAGKAAITVRQVMSHTSGVSGWEPPFSVTDMYDWDTAVARLAAQAPWWEPGTASGYHAQNWGHLLGEIVRRVSGKTLKQFVAEEIAQRLGADVQIGAAATDADRIAELVAPPPFDLTALDPDSVMAKTLAGLDVEAAATPEWRQADMGAINGHMNARGMARAMSVISRGGEVNGVRLLSSATIDRIFEQQAHEVDRSLGIPLQWGIGFGLPEPTTTPYFPTDERVCFWGGYGGSFTAIFPDWDTDQGMTISYFMNRMGPDTVGSKRWEVYIRAALEALAA